MKKIHLIACGVLLAGLMFSGTAQKVMASGQEGPFPKEDITIEGKKPAVFSHNKHLSIGITCAACHHDAEHKPLTEENIAALTDTASLQCVSCHNDSFANAELQKQKDVFHARCRECHKTGFNGKTGPSKCNACHIKTKKKLEGC